MNRREDDDHDARELAHRVRLTGQMVDPVLAGHVTRIHRILFENPEYRKLVEADRDDNAVEGTLFYDTALAACMVREHALKTGNTEVSGLKMAVIIGILGRLLERHNLPIFSTGDGMGRSCGSALTMWGTLSALRGSGLSERWVTGPVLNHWNWPTQPLPSKNSSAGKTTRSNSFIGLGVD